MKHIFLMTFHFSQKMCADEYEMRAKKHRKYHMGLVTRQGAEKSLSEVSEKQFRANFSVPPTLPDQPVEGKVKMYHNSIFFAGKMIAWLAHTETVKKIGRKKMNVHLKMFGCERTCIVH